MGDSTMDELFRRSEILRDLKIPTIPAVWLRPYSNDGLSLTASKIGGQFAWPQDVCWPICDGIDMHLRPEDIQNDYFVGLAQFRRDEFPEINFPSDSDILQILWCPRLHANPWMEGDLLGPNILVFWHRLRDLRPFTRPTPKCADLKLIPTECGFLPVKLDDTPPWWLLDDEQRVRLRKYYEETTLHTGDESVDQDLYREDLGTIPATKLLGYSVHQDESVNRNCVCGRQMALLFDIGSLEVDFGSGKWFRRYDHSVEFDNSISSIRPLGLDPLDGYMQIFYCDVCPGRPIATQWING